MAIYEFICHDCQVIWEREAAMSKAPSRSRCPECKKLSNRHWGDVPIMFNAKGFYTNTRKNHNLVHHDKEKAKQVHETLLDATKKMAEEKKTPYSNYTMTKEAFEDMKPRRKSQEQLENDKKVGEELKASLYNNSAAYRNLGKR